MMKIKKKLILGIAICGCILFGGCNTSDKSVPEIQPESEQETNDFESEEIQVEVETEFTYGEMNEDFYLVIEDVFALVDRNDVVIVGVNHNSPLYINADVDVLSGDERIETRVGAIEVYGETVDAVPEETNVGILLEGLTKEDIQAGDIIVLRGCNKVTEEEVLQSYEEFLTDYEQLSDEAYGKESPGFALIYLDNDDIPELVIIEGQTYLHRVNVYTYEQGKTVLVGEYGKYGTMIYQEKEGIVLDEYPIDDMEVSEEQYGEGDGSSQDANIKVIDYDMCISLINENIKEVLTEELEILILTQKEVLKRKVLTESGMEESSVLLMDYDDYDRDGRYEAFVFCGECITHNDNKYYNGEIWFVGADQCIKLRKGSYRMIDGNMRIGDDQKYLYFYSDICFTANISELWTVVDGEPVESKFSQIGQVVYRGGSDFEIWIDAYDHWYEPENDFWMGHTYKPYFYYYDLSTDQIERYAGEIISKEQLELLCGFDLAAEVEAEGYEVTEMIRWGNDIVTVNYVIPIKEDDPIPQIIYENIIWDCNAKDYWRKTERGVTSWKNAGVGGSFHL